MSNYLEELINLSIEYINRSGLLLRLKEKYKIKENRSLKVTIISESEKRYGFVADINSGKVYTIEKFEGKPTVEIIVPEEVIWQILAGKETFAGAFFKGKLIMKGEYWVRDFKILNDLFTTAYREVIK